MTVLLIRSARHMSNPTAATLKETFLRHFHTPTTLHIDAGRGDVRITVLAAAAAVVEAAHLYIDPTGWRWQIEDDQPAEATRA